MLIVMVELETKKLLKIFGVTVTDFEDESNQIVQRAREVLGSSSSDSAKKFAELARDAVELAADMNAKWLEVTNYMHAQQKKMYDELARLSKEVFPASGA